MRGVSGVREGVLGVPAGRKGGYQVNEGLLLFQFTTASAE